MAIAKLFKNRKQTVRIIGPSLRQYQFTLGRYFTTDAKEIEELTKIANAGSCSIYIDPKETEIDTEAADPISLMKKTMREQILEELAASGKLLEPSTSVAPSPTAGIVNTASSTITNNSMAEMNELDRLEAVADSQVAAIVAEQPTLTALQKLQLAAGKSISQ